MPLSWRGLLSHCLSSIDLFLAGVPTAFLCAFGTARPLGCPVGDSCWILLPWSVPLSLCAVSTVLDRSGSLFCCPCIVNSLFSVHSGFFRHLFNGVFFSPPLVGASYILSGAGVVLQGTESFFFLVASCLKYWLGFLSL